MSSHCIDLWTSTSRLTIAASLVVVLLLVPKSTPYVFAQVTPTSVPAGYRGSDQGSTYTGTFSDLAFAIDDFWKQTLEGERVAYRSPAISALDTQLRSACGIVGPEHRAIYCPGDETIYLNSAFLTQQHLTIGDYAVILILAHEWGHHAQLLTSASDVGNNTFELQADCLAGVYTQAAEIQGLLDPGDITEAVIMSQAVGDPIGLPQDQPGAHGINDDRIKAFMSGYLNGLDACNLPLQQAQIIEVDTGSSFPASSYLPSVLPVPNAACFYVQGQGIYHEADVTSFLSSAGATEQEIYDLGWQDGAYIDFRCDSPAAGSTGFLEVVIHRFATEEAALTAVPIWQSGYIPSQVNEVYICSNAGPFLVCADGISPLGSPGADVRALLEQVLAGVG